jgi:hypothetical protein
MAIAINIASSIGIPKELSIASAVFLIIDPTTQDLQLKLTTNFSPLGKE